jgi:hypothetical protein
VLRLDYRWQEQTDDFTQGQDWTIWESKS